MKKNLKNASFCLFFMFSYAYTLLELYASCAKDDVACLRHFAKLLFSFFFGCFALCLDPIRMIAKSQLTIGLPHLVVCGSLAYAKGSIGFLQSYIDIWLPLVLIFLVAREVVRAFLVGKVNGGASIHRIEQPAQQEAEDESTTSSHSPTYKGKDESKVKQARHLLVKS